MKNIWSERVSLGPHPDAKVVLDAPMEQGWGEHEVSFHVDAFWAEEQRVLLVQAQVGMSEAMRELPSLHSHESLQRLSGAKRSPAALVRQVLGFTDAWAAAARAHLAALVPFCRCSHGDGSMAEAVMVQDGDKPLWKLPPGWFRADGPRWASTFCPEHRAGVSADGRNYVYELDIGGRRARETRTIVEHG